MSAPRTSPAARGMLFGLWKQLAQRAGWDKAEEDAERADFTARALSVYPGEPVPSWSALKSGQIDDLKKALDEAMGRLALESTAAGAESTADAARRRRLVYGIRKDMTAAYGSEEDGAMAIRSICLDIYGPSSPEAAGKWEGMDLDELEKLRITAARCLRGRQNSKTGEKTRVLREDCPF